MLAADVNFATGVMLLEYAAGSDPRAEAVAIARGSGHGVEALGADAEALSAPTWWQRHGTETAVASSGALIGAGWALGAADAQALSIAAYALAIIAGGLVTGRRALASLRARSLDMNVLMSIAVAGAALIGEWSEGATVIFLFALGGWLESRALARTRRSIRDLMALTPEVVRVLRGGREATVPAAGVAVGELVVVRPGERVALDGEIVSGSSALDESPITGESVPVDKAEGDAVFAGSLNTSGLLELKVTAPASESTLSRIVYLVEEAQASKAPSQRFVDRFSRWYTPTVLLIALAVAVVPPIAGELGAPWAGLEAWTTWFYRALVMLVVACPCALVLSTPVAIVSGISRATRDGVLIKGGAFLERAADVRAVAFDKTGTITHGRPELTETVVLDDIEPAEALALAAALEAASPHPVARALVRAAGAELERGRVTGVEELPGRGVRGTLDGSAVAVGGSVFVEESGLLHGPVAETFARLEADGRTVLALMRDGKVIAAFGISDTVRDEAPAAMAALAAIGIGDVTMLTGDNERTAAAAAEHAGIPRYRARLLPEEKVAAVREIRERAGVVAMVGDGINDAPALAVADIGIAMGAAGSDTALETADVALMNDDLAAVPRFLELGRRTVAIIRQNVAFSIAVKFVVLALAVFGKATLWMAVFADMGVSLIVVGNGLRLLRFKGKGISA